MSKIVMSLPKGMVKNSLIGGVLALAAYVALQFFCALLIDKGIMGMEQLYPMVCVAAALSSFLGCGYSVLKGKGTSMLSIRLPHPDADSCVLYGRCHLHRKRLDRTGAVYGGWWPVGGHCRL